LRARQQALGDVGAEVLLLRRRHRGTEEAHPQHQIAQQWIGPQQAGREDFAQDDLQESEARSSRGWRRRARAISAFWSSRFGG
jgi:hypothetical protein